MKLLQVLMVMFMLTSIASAASLDGVYVGTLGKSAIALKLETDKNSLVTGSYYYRNHAIDIRLEGKLSNSVVSLSEFESDRTGVTAKISLKSAGNTFSGNWASVKQPKKTLAISLHRINAKDLNAIKLPSTKLINKWKLEQPFDYLRFDAPAKLVKTEIMNGKKVQWWLEPKSKIEFLRLPSENKTVNDVLTDAHYNTAISDLECLSSGNGEYTYEPKVTLYSKRILSVSASVYYYCGGAHPDNGAENLNLDLSTGKDLNVEDVYHFVPIPEGLKIDPNDYSEAYGKYLEARGAAIKKLILTGFGSFTKALGTDVDKECASAYTDESFSYFSWYLTPKGVVIQSDFPHVAAACESEFELPYASLVQYLAPNSPLR
jgi:hypothetical protein